MSQIPDHPSIAPAPPLTLITGLSGAGKSTAIRVFDDLGYYCLDNLPPALIHDVYHLYQNSHQMGIGVVVVCDVRSGDLFDDFKTAIDQLRSTGVPHTIIYLDCSTEVLMNRFKEVRRTHPLEPAFSIEEAIREEKRRTEPILNFSPTVIDTSRLNTNALRSLVLTTAVGEEKTNAIRLVISSFGFKYGVPRDADFVVDARFLPNPFYVEELRPLSGQDSPVYEYVMGCASTRGFIDKIVALLDHTMNGFVDVGKYSISVAVGCTGGRHRSVSIARALSTHYRDLGLNVNENHRDINQGN